MMSRGGRTAVVDGWREKDCMLDYKYPASAYKDFCVEKKRPLIFVWGDSHAGSLYPGFKALQDGGKYQFGLGERTAAICPPVLGIEPRPLCQSLNDSSIDAIRQSKPDVVILYAWWHNKRYDLRNLESTVAEIKKAGVPRIILLGAVPYWQKALPLILMEEWKKGPPTRLPPLRLKEGLDPDLDEATAIMRARSERMGIEFISGMQFFCNEEGCLTRLNEDAKQPLSYDYGHLSTSAVIYYVEQLAPLIFRETLRSESLQKEKNRVWRGFFIEADAQALPPASDQQSFECTRHAWQSDSGNASLCCCTTNKIGPARGTDLQATWCEDTTPSLPPRVPVKPALQTKKNRARPGFLLGTKPHVCSRSARLTACHRTAWASTFGAARSKLTTTHRCALGVATVAEAVTGAAGCAGVVGTTKAGEARLGTGTGWRTVGKVAPRPAGRLSPPRGSKRLSGRCSPRLSKRLSARGAAARLSKRPSGRCCSKRPPSLPRLSKRLPSKRGPS